eukprot:1542296-Rhodomonas_salina.4
MPGTDIAYGATRPLSNGTGYIGGGAGCYQVSRTPLCAYAFPRQCLVLRSRVLRYQSALKRRHFRSAMLSPYALCSTDKACRLLRYAPTRCPLCPYALSAKLWEDFGVNWKGKPLDGATGIDKIYDTEHFEGIWKQNHILTEMLCIDTPVSALLPAMLLREPQYCTRD